MKYVDFEKSMSHDDPPDLSAPLRALWLDGKGEWDQAHTLIQDAMSGDEAWVHAYLHRKEGDIWNADYWYERADKKRPDITLAEEWEAMVKSMLSQF